MYKNILVAHDGSAYSSAALDQAVDLARLCGAELHLLAVASTSGGMGLAEAAGAIDVWGIEEQRLRKALNAISEHLAREGITTTTEVRLGIPGIEIGNYAGEIGADLVVVGHTDKGIFARWFEGSIGSELLSHLPCSLLIAPPGH